MFKVNVFNNGDHACVAWRPESSDPASWTKIDGCRGFAIERKLVRGGATTTSWLSNRVGFQQGEEKPDPAEAWRWPVQRYLWWDYDVEPGDNVSYRIWPVTGTAAKLQPPDTSQENSWSEPQSLASDFGDGVSAWFNRGVVATQWVTRALKDQAAKDGKGSPRSTLLDVVSKPGNPLRDELGGLLKAEVLELLRAPPGPIYAALYELNDPEVKGALITLGSNCNLILGNGAFKAGEKDENAKVRSELRATSINLHDRIVGTGHFAHNKFIVFCDEAGTPRSVFTGSTNLTMTGLCTQVNNGILITDDNVAMDYFKAWGRLKDAGNTYPPELIQANSTVTKRSLGSTSVSAWFASTSQAQDLMDARSRITAAKDGILFLFFNPGVMSHEPLKETLLQDVNERNAKGDLYVRGVVNQEIAGLTDADSSMLAPVHLVSSGRATEHLPKSVLVPAAIKQAYSDWEAELKGASSVMVHSKVIVIDPFGTKPAVMTGSHNMGYKASHSNDDNLNIVEGNGPLARAYAANIVAIYQEYRWRQYVAGHATGGWKGLEDNDTWQSGHLEREARELLFWVP